MIGPRHLTLAPDLTLPIDAVTQTFLIVGKRGSGKSNTAARFVEQLHRAGLPFVVLDPTDTWWGLKAARDGGQGLGVYVFGGRHADLPLEPGAGALIAEVLCQHRIPMVLSVKHLSGRERSTFMVAFAQALFQRWQGGPLHVVLEEAHELAPQSTQNAREGEQQMLGAFKRLWKLGRASGIGGTAVTQRPASLSKDITTQSEILIAHRTIGPQDVDAVGAWVKYHGENLGILAQLPTLPTGEAFVWAPEFPEGQALGLRRVAIARRETFDSASTPKVGEARVEPRELAAVDLERLRTQMAATIERAKADDPRELRRQIAELKAEAAFNKAAQPTAPRVQVEIREVEVLGEEPLVRLEAIVKALDEAARLADETSDKAVAAAAAIRSDLAKVTGRAAVDDPDECPFGPPAVRVERPRRTVERTLDRLAPAPPPGAGRPLPRLPAHLGMTAEAGKPIAIDGLTPVQHRLLDALAELEVLGATAPERVQVAFLAGYSNLTSKGFANALGALHTDALVAYPATGRIALTEMGRMAARYPEAARTTAEVQRRVLDLLGGVHARVLEPLIGAYPRPLHRLALASQAGYTNLTSKGFANALGRLRSLGFIDYPGTGQVVASPVLFLEGRK